MQSVSCVLERRTFKRKMQCMFMVCIPVNSGTFEAVKFIYLCMYLFTYKYFSSD